MHETVDAIYENGVLRPLRPLSSIEDKHRVKLTVVDEGPLHPLTDCIGILPDEDAREMQQVIEGEFEKVDPDEWK